MRPAWGVWRPLSSEAHQRIGRWRGRPLPVVWKMSPTEVREALLTHRLPAGDIRRGMLIQDLLAIRRGWSTEEQVALLRGGAGLQIEVSSPAWELVELAEFPGILAHAGPAAINRLRGRLNELADARPWLAMMAQGDAGKLRALAERCLSVDGARADATELWQAFCASAVGTPEWLAVREEAMRGISVLRQVIAMLGARRKAVDPDALRVAVAQALHDPAQQIRHARVLCLRWFKLDAQAMPVLLRLGPRDLLLRIAASPIARRVLGARIKAFRDRGASGSPIQGNHDAEARSRALS